MKGLCEVKRLKHLIVSLLLTCVAAGCSSSTNTDPNIQGLQEVLRTDFPTVQGNQQSIAEYRNNIVLLHFFASWCVECSAEAPTLRNLQNAFKGSDFQVIGVAVDDDPFDAQRFVTNYQLQFPVIFDAQGELKHYFSIRDLPVTMILDRQGIPVSFQDPETGGYTAKLTGARRWDTERPVEMIASMIEAP